MRSSLIANGRLVQFQYDSKEMKWVWPAQWQAGPHLLESVVQACHCCLACQLPCSSFQLHFSKTQVVRVLLIWCFAHYCQAIAGQTRFVGACLSMEPELDMSSLKTASLQGADSTPKDVTSHELPNRTDC